MAETGKIQEEMIEVRDSSGTCNLTTALNPHPTLSLGKGEANPFTKDRHPATAHPAFARSLLIESSCNNDPERKIDLGFLAEILDGRMPGH